MLSRERVEHILSNLVSTIEDLSESDRKWSVALRISRHENPEAYQTTDDEHRKYAFGRFDELLEQGLLTPNEVERARKDWDVRHGY